ncbi:MAG: antibiotic biosynthesis monooxygenase [Pseudomonadota bacterium]
MAERVTEKEAVAAVITHDVCPHHHEAYEAWLSEISSVGRTFPGYMRADFYRPLKDSLEPHQVVLTFETSEQLQNWLGSEERAALLEKASHLIEKETRSQHRGELQQLVGVEAPTSAPKYKMVLLTWLGVTILTSLSGLLVEPFLQDVAYLSARAIVAGVVVLLLAYGLLPVLTRLFRWWLR